MEEQWDFGVKYNNQTAGISGGGGGIPVEGRGGSSTVAEDIEAPVYH
jgi:hypothetical protein